MGCTDKKSGDKILRIHNAVRKYHLRLHLDELRERRAKHLFIVMIAAKAPQAGENVASLHNCTRPSDIVETAQRLIVSVGVGHLRDELVTET